MLQPFSWLIGPGLHQSMVRLKPRVRGWLELLVKRWTNVARFGSCGSLVLTYAQVHLQHSSCRFNALSCLLAPSVLLPSSLLLALPATKQAVADFDLSHELSLDTCQMDQLTQFVLSVPHVL